MIDIGGFGSALSGLASAYGYGQAGLAQQSAISQLGATQGLRNFNRPAWAIQDARTQRYQEIIRVKCEAEHMKILSGNYNKEEKKDNLPLRESLQKETDDWLKNSL